MKIYNDNPAVGVNNADNKFDSSLVVGNRDGSLLERSEFIISMLTGGAADLRVSQSIAGTVEEAGFLQFTVGLMDIDTGAIASANIDITSITQTMERSRGGAAWSAMTAPVFAKMNGQVYCSYEFLAAEWQTGDMYRLTLSGVVCTIGTATAYVPAMIWSNIVVETEEIITKIDAVKTVADNIYIDTQAISVVVNDIQTNLLPDISADISSLQTDVGDPSTRTNLKSIEAMLGNPDAAGKTIYGNVGDFVANTNLKTLKDALAIPDTAGKGLYTEIVTDRLDNASYGLSALNTDLDAIISKLATGVGQPQIATATKDLNTAGTYDVFTATTEDVLLEAFSVKMPTGAAGGTLTSIEIKTDDATPAVIINTTTGAVANLTSEAELSWTGCMRIRENKKIKLVVSGGHGSEYLIQIVAKYCAIVAGGTLA